MGMYLVFTPSAYMGDALMNYKSLECYQRFIAGWVREILLSVQGERNGSEYLTVTGTVSIQGVEKERCLQLS